MKKESVAKYEQMESTKEWFPNYLRVYLEWDDTKYQEMYSNVRQVIEDYSSSDFFPKSVRYFFTSEIDHIIGTISNDLFLKKIPKGFTNEEFISLLKRREMELLDLKEEFFYGAI